MNFNYKYLIEENASKLCQLPLHKHDLNILCYSINEEIMEPFLLFMVEEKNNLLNFPKLLLPINEEFNVEDELLNVFSQPFIYYGIICDNFNNYYAVVKVNDISDGNFFALATEIINNKKINNYPFSKEIINLFIKNPIFYLLINNNTKYPYKSPDVAYKYINSDEINYYLNFKSKKEKFFESCEEYYFFNKSIDPLLRYITVVRYAIFTGNKIHFENNEELILNDYEIDELLEDDKYKTIIISYLVKNHNYPDILVVNYDNFLPLSYTDIN